MAISDKHRKMITEEIHFIVSKMDESQEPDRKLYFFSGVHSIVQRILNFEYDADLIGLHLVLQSTYGAFSARLQAIQKGGERIVLLEEAHFAKLSKLSKDLARNMEKKQDTSETLKKFAVLSYSTTGNGFYLREKGLLKIEEL